MEAIPGEDSCLPGRSGDRQCCVLRNLAVEDQFGVNPSYLYGLVIPERTNLLDGPDMIQTHSSIGYGYRFNSIQYREPLVKHDLGIASTADPTAQQVKVFQFIIGELILYSKCICWAYIEPWTHFIITVSIMRGVK